MAKKNVFGAVPARDKVKDDLEAKLADEPKLVRINFEVTEATRNAFKAKAAAEGLSMREVLEGLVETYLAES